MTATLTRDQAEAVTRTILDKVRSDPAGAEDLLVSLPHLALVTLAATMARQLATMP